MGSPRAERPQRTQADRMAALAGQDRERRKKEDFRSFQPAPNILAPEKTRMIDMRAILAEHEAHTREALGDAEHELDLVYDGPENDGPTAKPGPKEKTEKHASMVTGGGSHTTDRSPEAKLAIVREQIRDRKRLLQTHEIAMLQAGDELKRLKSEQEAKQSSASVFEKARSFFSREGRTERGTLAEAEGLVKEYQKILARDRKEMARLTRLEADFSKIK